MLALSLAITVGGTSARADVTVEGNILAVRLEVSHAPVSEVLSALRVAFNLRYRSSIPLDQGIHGTYTGRLERVISRVLDGYNYYVVKSEGDAVDVVVVGASGNRAVVVETPVETPKTSKGSPRLPGTPKGHRRGP